MLYMQLDLASLKSVHSFSQTFLKTESRLDLLINNAGKFTVTQSHCVVSHHHCKDDDLQQRRTSPIVVGFAPTTFNLCRCGGRRSHGRRLRGGVWSEPPGPLPADVSAAGAIEGVGRRTCGHRVLHGLPLGTHRLRGRPSGC